MVALDIGPKDEVITTPFTFVASSNTILFSGAIPVFVDIDRETYNIDPEKIEEASKEVIEKVDLPQFKGPGINLYEPEVIEEPIISDE